MRAGTRPAPTGVAWGIAETGPGGRFCLLRRRWRAWCGSGVWCWLLAQAHVGAGAESEDACAECPVGEEDYNERLRDDGIE